MGKSNSKGTRYTPEFRRQMVELVRAGRKPSELQREFGVTSWSIGRWVAQAERDAGRGDGGMTSAERQELARLRRENRQLKLEREILSKPRPGLRRRPQRLRSALRIRERESGQLSGGEDVPVAPGLQERTVSPTTA